MSDAAASGPLGPIRVLDLTTPLGESAGRVFADLGAEVLKIEPPGGCAARFTPPFIDGREGSAEGSLFWKAWGLGKHSVVLDLENATDRSRFLDLARGADVLLESFTPGALDAQGLGYEALREINPSLLYVSITPFGATGPEATSPATDLTLSAAGGLMNLQGDRDRPPVPVGYPETSCHGAVQAAADAIMALYRRHRTGKGQHLDTSMQAAVLWTLLFATGYVALSGKNHPGSGEERSDPAPELLPGLVLPDRAACADGEVVMTLLLGEVGARSFGSMMRWVHDEGGLDDDLAEVVWQDWLQQIIEGKLTPADAARGIEQFVAFLGQRTKADIQERATENKWLIGPVYSVADLLVDRQHEARNYWTEVDGTVHPGPFAHLSKTPIRYRRPAPTLGQDQALAGAAIRRPSVPERLSVRECTSIFEGLRVADFSWVGAGPLVAKDLANLGAHVIRVESEKHVDPLRSIPPWVDGTPDVSTGHTMANFNQSKLGVALDLQTDAGREVAYRIVDQADVVIESFTPGTAAKLGLDYETLRLRKPDIVMFSSCLRGQSGPEASYTGFGLQGSGLAGFVAITGWPDRLPSGPWGAYTDFISPRFSLAALGAALHHRDRSGEGQYIDLSQIEAAIHLLEPLVLDYTVNGRLMARPGLDSERACPHGVFACEGKDRFAAIAVETPEQWRALRACTGLWSSEQAPLWDLGERIARKAEIEAPLASWCAGQEPFALARRLREAGVPANVVMRATDLHEDPQLLHRNFFLELDHPRIGPTLYDGPVTLFSSTPAVPTHAGPTIGQHTFEVLKDVLGYSEDEISELAAAGVLT